MHEISNNMKNVHKISENICKKAFISLKFIKNEQDLHYQKGICPPNVKNKFIKKVLKRP